MGGDRRCRPRQGPKTYSRWLRCTLLANGINHDLDRDDAEAVAEFLLATGRAVHPARWVEYQVERVRQAAMEGIY